MTEEWRKFLNVSAESEIKQRTILNYEMSYAGLEPGDMVEIKIRNEEPVYLMKTEDGKLVQVNRG